MPAASTAPINASDDTRRSFVKRMWLLGAGVWLVFWTLMFGLGVQEYLRSGGRHLWEPFLDYGTSTLVATVIAVLHIRHTRRLDGLLAAPRRWFVRAWRWLPLTALGFVAVNYALRHSIRTLIGFPYRHECWPEVIVYESAKFALFFMLFSAVLFGVRSYLAWHAERLRTEQQARLANEAQLLQLTQQLQPHFLFNALNTVSSLIHTDPDLADALLTRLATLLRAATDAAQRPEQPLADELALLRAYADIMTTRFGDRASVQWDIAPDALPCKVPTLGLQPLLENCFRHVVEARRAPTRMRISARRDATRLHIEVEDDGPERTAPAPFGTGLGNLQRRLAARHGSDASVSLLARNGGGTVVQVDLPCVC